MKTHLPTDQNPPNLTTSNLKNTQETKVLCFDELCFQGGVRTLKRWISRRMKNQQIDYRSGQPVAIENIHLFK